jgi:hypothetical protein
MGKKYMDTKKGSLESSVLDVWQDAVNNEDSTDAISRMDGRTKSYRQHRAKLEAARVKREAKKLDAVNPNAVKKKFDDRKDKDIDNDGDVDSSDKYLHKRRKAVSKAVKNEEVELDEAKGSTKYVVMQGPGDNNQKVIATFDGGPKALEKAKKFRDDWNKKNKSKIKLNKKGKPIAAHMARIFDKGVETSYKVGDKVSYSAFAPSIIKDEVELDEGKMKDLSMKVDAVIAKMKKHRDMKGFADKFKKDVAKSMNIGKSLEKVLPDYIAGKDIQKLMGEAYELGTDEYREYLEDLTPGEESDWTKAQNSKVDSMKEAIAKIWGLDEWKNQKENRRVDGGDKRRTENKNGGRTLTGKKAAAVEVEPELKEKKK